MDICSRLTRAYPSRAAEFATLICQRFVYQLIRGVTHGRDYSDNRIAFLIGFDEPRGHSLDPFGSFTELPPYFCTMILNRHSPEKAT